MTAPRLTGSRCQCMVCGDYFGSERGFDRHRVGEIGAPDRRCLAATELAASGWVRDRRGFWLQPDPRRAEAGLDAASVAQAEAVPPNGTAPPLGGSQHV